MAGGADRQVLGHALDDAEDHCLTGGHRAPPYRRFLLGDCCRRAGDEEKNGQREIFQR
ncbi:MAG: hypothetical protein ACD_75C00591G0001, partial [uncultured bacterium]